MKSSSNELLIKSGSQAEFAQGKISAEKKL
jgi:hypothetical protein